MSITKLQGVDLPEDINSILEKDFWVLEHVSGSMVRAFAGPAKFSTFTSIFMRKGTFQADINLIRHEFSGPCIVNIHSSQILQPLYISPDFDAGFIVLSRRMMENIFLFIKDNPLYALIRRYPVVKVEPSDLDGYEGLYRELADISKETSNPNGYQTVVHTLLSFFFRSGYRLYEPLKGKFPTSQGLLADKFLVLVQQNFRTERFLDFYAAKLGITAKHLSRAVKQQTGYTAVEWLERFVILEAKALLRSSNLNIQQISDELNFNSQSFFGKYFKKYVGMSPKEFRNSGMKTDDI